MMRKTFLILLGAASGVALTLLATQPRLVPVGLGFGSSAKAAAADTYKQLNLFGDVFERASLAPRADEIVANLHARSAGNPLFLVEAMRDLGDDSEPAPQPENGV